jgi:hypothetical protein
MQCSLFQSLLHQAIESHADSVSPEVRTHGVTCSHEACRQEWAEYSLLSQAVAKWRSGLPQVDLTERVLAELLPAVPLSEASSETASAPALKAFVEQSWHDFRSPSQRPWAMALSVVGLMLLIGTLIISIPHSPNAEVVVRPRHNPTPAPLAPPREQWASRSPQHPNVAVQSVEWAQRASSVMAQTIVSIPERGADWVPSDSWDVNWKHQFEPIRRDAHAAWDALLEELPMPVQPSS